jgi:hypothetical protein
MWSRKKSIKWSLRNRKIIIFRNIVESGKNNAYEGEVGVESKRIPNPPP